METNNIILNWKRQPEDNRDFKSTRHLTAPVELPSQFELDAQIPIYDQQDLGSCTANSGCACYRYEYKQLKGDFKFDPSRLYLYYNTREIEGWENEDSGAYIRDVFKALNKKGLCEEQYFPYVSADFAKKPTTAALENGQKYQTVKYAVVEQSEQAIKQTLLSGAAVSFGFDVYSSFMYGSWKEVSPIPKDGEQLLGGHACFTKDTKVSLLNGQELTMEQLVDEYAGSEFWVYSYDIKQNKIVPGKAHSPRKTASNKEILKITLDNGEIIRCTTNHPFLLRSGEYLNADKLVVGESLMPLYRKNDERGYEMILNNRKWQYTHRTMVDWDNKESKDMTTVHHVDFNKRNNEPTNLQLMTWDEHTKLHSDNCKLLNNYAQSEVGRKRSSEIMSRNWANPEWRERRIAQNKINGNTTTENRKRDGKPAFPNWSVEQRSEMGRKNGLNNVHNMHSVSANAKKQDTLKRKMQTDAEFANLKRNTAKKNIQTYNDSIKSIGYTPEELIKKQETAKQNIKNVTSQQRRLAQLRTTYNRWYTSKFSTFEDYLNECYPNNHKIVSIESDGFEDVYDITVDEYHNFALSAGVFVHNCTVIGYSDAKQAFLIQNSWGTDWKLNGKFWMPYSFVTNPSYADDFWCIETINVVSDNPTPQPENIKERVKSIFTESVILDASKSTIQHLASLVGCNLSGVFRSKIAKQLRDFLYK